MIGGERRARVLVQMIPLTVALRMIAWASATQEPRRDFENTHGRSTKQSSYRRIITKYCMYQKAPFIATGVFVTIVIELLPISYLLR
jgi:hypothetical protein